MAEPPPSYGDDQRTPTHKYRPSVVTNASALAESTITFGTSIMSSDGFSRLSHFPPPPEDIPFSPLEEVLGVPSPVRSDYSQSTMVTSSTVRRPLPVPPVPTVAPLNVQKRPLGAVQDLNSDASLVDPSSSSRHRASITPPAAVPSLSGTPSTASVYPSPHDWHDGSSSIANDPYGDNALSTSFITSLLSSISGEDGGPEFPPSSFPAKRAGYEPSVISNALTVDSTITYPPPRLYPPPLPSPRAYPSVPPLPIRPDSPQGLPLPSIPVAGRSTPETLRSFDSTDTVRQGSTKSHILSVAPGTVRSMSTTPSLQSLNSSTPLMQNVVHGETIPEEEEPKTASGSGPSTPGKSRSSRGRRGSVAYSSKSAKSYVSSLVARVSHSSSEARQAAVAWFRGKPLPPVPPLPNLAIRDVRKAEDALDLPDLVNRAQALSHMLDNGQRPYDSDSIIKAENLHQPADGEYRIGPTSGVWNSGTNPNLMSTARGRRGRSEDFSQQSDTPSSPVRLRKISWSTMSKKQRVTIIVVFMVLVVIITLAIGVGVGVSEKKGHAHICPGSFAGAACDLNAACTCISTIPGQQCKQLAQSLFSLIAVMNTAFSSNYTADDVATAIWEAQGISATGNNCAPQVDIIDVGPALDLTTSPNRTQWAQSALLWNFVRSESTSDNTNMRNFVQQADWHSLQTQDGPTSDSPEQFTLQSSGYSFNFAAQTVTAPTKTFAESGEPSSEQSSRVNDVARSALDRMYTFAVASSTQQQSALMHFWTGDLQQSADSLSTFISNLEGTSILLPFDATLSLGSTPLVSLINSTSPPPFPPPLACFAGLNSSQLQVANAIETSIFALPSASAATSFDPSCFPNRPVYGVLDILQLRLPFSDSRTGVAKQAAVLSGDVASRAVVYSGEAVSALPGTSSPAPLSTDPRDYGTMNNLQHVILKYLRSVDIATATALVDFILHRTALPPAQSSSLFNAIPSLPLLEVAVFGTIDPSDITSVQSSLSNVTDGGLFFGTTASSIMRNWTIESVQGTVVWTENATAPVVVRDSGNSNELFNDIWLSAFDFIHLPSNAVVTESNITFSFNVTGLTSPS